MTPEENFISVAPKYMSLFIKDFDVSVEDASAVFGNAGYESKGLTDDQEDKPVVKGSRGGANWMQWTGPRRRQFEAYCAKHGYDPNSDEAAYKWLFVELTTTEKSALDKLKAASSLADKVIAFEKAYLRAGVKNYPKRVAWANIALNAYKKAFPTPSVPEPVPTPEPVKEDPLWLRILKIILKVFFK